MNTHFQPNAHQTLTMVACMLAVAHVDGVQPEETAVIRGFYEAGVSLHSELPPFDVIKGSHEHVLKWLSEAQALLDGTMDFPVALLAACLYTGYADGSLSDAERALIRDFARALHVPEADVDQILQQVKDSLLGSMAHLPVLESVAAIAKDL